MIIKNTKSAGKFASDFKYTVLEAIEVEKESRKGIAFDYAKPYYKNFRKGKMNDCEMNIEMGCVFSGYAKKRFEWVGEVINSLTKADFVEGKTFYIKEEIKKLGFVWNANSRRWEREWK